MKYRGKNNPLRYARDKRHGTATGYNYYGCRCPRCREASTESARTYYTPESVTTHGAVGYRRGCRCQECTTGQHERDRELLRKKREWKANNGGAKPARKVPLSGLK